MKSGLLAAAVLAAAPWLSVAAEGESLSVSLVTFSPGPTYWQRFGHNALVVHDQATGEALAYHWGVFDFEQENFFLNFARGRMRYEIGVADAGRMLAYYRREGRSALGQRLNLTPPQRAALDRFLRWNAQPENAEYPYDYFLDNCSTRLRDALDDVLGGALRRALTGRPAGITYRSESVRLLWPERALALTMDLALGPPADGPLDLWHAAFSPVVLMESLRQVTVADGAAGAQALVAGETDLYFGPLPDPPARYPQPLAAFLAGGLLMAAALLALAYGGRRRTLGVLAAAWLAVLGMGGLASGCLWALTEHWAGAQNPLLLLLNPLCLLLLPGWLRRAPVYNSAHRRIAMLVFAMALASPLVLWSAGSPNWHWLALLLPVHAALASLSLWHNPRPPHET